MKVDRMVGEAEGTLRLTLALSGDLDPSCATELRDILLGALATAPHLVIDTSAVAGAEASSVQLLCAAHKTAVRTGKQLVLQNASEAISRVVRNAGFLRREGCLKGLERDCLWIKGGREWPSEL
jgi:anti-anti-sigma factor